MADQNDRFGLRPHHALGGVDEEFKRSGIVRHRVRAPRGQVERHNLVALGLEQGHNFFPAPRTVHMAMDKNNGRQNHPPKLKTWARNLGRKS